MRTLRAFLFVALVSISFLKAQGVTYNQEFKVNTYNDKIDGYPAVTSLSNGGYVVCWVSRYYEDGSNWGSFISGQVYDSSSMAVNQEFKMNKLNKTTGDPPIIKKTDAGFAIFGDGYQYQEFNNNGQKIGKEIFLRKSGAGIQWDSDFDVLTNGNIVLCYTDHDDDFDTYFVIFNDENTRLTANTKVNTYTDGEQGYSYVCSLKDSNFVVFWHSKQDEGRWVVKGQLFKNDGSKIKSEFQIDDNSTYDQWMTSLSALSNGGFILCFYTKDSNIGNIYGQKFDRYGNVDGNIFRINNKSLINSGNGNYYELGENEFWATWIQGDYREFTFYGQYFDNKNNRIGKIFPISENPNFSTLYDICTFNMKNIFICWDGPGEQNKRDIFGKYFLGEPLNHTLTSYSLLSPSYDETMQSADLKFIWDKATVEHINLPFEIDYTLYLDEDDDFSCPTVIDSIYDTTYTMQNLTPGTTYFWKMLAKNIVGDSLWSTETNGFFVSHDATAIKHQNSNNKFQTFELFPNYPNPFNPETTIKYNLPAKQTVYQVKVKIYDALGRLITTLKDESQNPGMHSIRWNGKNTAGQNMPSGIYFCVVEAGKYKATQKMLLVR